MTEYSLFLKNLAKDINIQKKAPNFDKLLQTIMLEQEIDFPGVDDERTRLIDELTKNADKQKSDEMVQKSLDFRQGNINAVDYYGYLKEEYKNDLAKEYPNLEKYIRYITIHRDIDTHNLFSEIDEFSWLVRKEYYENNDQKTLDHIARKLTILEGLFGLELTPDEYKYYLANQKEFRNAKSWIKDIEKLARKLNLSVSMYTDVTAVTDNIPLLDHFYNTVHERDKAFIRKAEQAFEEVNKNALILVAGGFHTPHLVNLLNKEQYSYIVIAPKIENPTPPGLYEKVKREQIKRQKEEQNK